MGGTRPTARHHKSCPHSSLGCQVSSQPVTTQIRVSNACRVTHIIKDFETHSFSFSAQAQVPAQPQVPAQAQAAFAPSPMNSYQAPTPSPQPMARNEVPNTAQVSEPFLYQSPNFLQHFKIDPLINIYCWLILPAWVPKNLPSLPK